MCRWNFVLFKLCQTVVWSLDANVGERGSGWGYVTLVAINIGKNARFVFHFVRLLVVVNVMCRWDFVCLNFSDRRFWSYGSWVVWSSDINVNAYEGLNWVYTVIKTYIRRCHADNQGQIFILLVRKIHGQGMRHRCSSFHSHHFGRFRCSCFRSRSELVSFRESLALRLSLSLFLLSLSLAHYLSSSLCPFGTLGLATSIFGLLTSIFGW